MNTNDPAVDPARRECSFAGLRYTSEPCPDATHSDAFKSAALGGGGAWLAAALLGASPLARLAAVAAGAFAGSFASRHHVYLDWDPDRLRYGSSQSDGPPSDDPLPPAPTGRGF